MTRPIVQLHTIQQWLQQTPTIQSTILQNIRLRYRLEMWMRSRAERPALQEVISEPCYRCEGTGTIKHFPRLPGIHPSSLGSSCLLQIYNEMIGKPGREKFDFRFQLIYNLGSAAHLMFQGYGLKGAWGPYYKPESRICEELQDIAYDLLLEGSADAENILVIDDIAGSDTIYEVGLIHEYKTINDAGFKKLARPKPEHQQQAVVYSVALNRPIVVYLYMNKNDQSIAEFPVAYDASVWAEIENKAKRLNAFYDRDEAPPGNVNRYECEDCRYSYDCPDYLRARGGT